MSFTVRTLAIRAWAVLHDADEPHVWQEPDIVMWTADAQTEVLSLRPDARLDVDGTQLTVTEPTVIDSTVALAARWRAIMLDYVLARCYEMRGETYNEAKAKYHQDRFAAFVKV